MVAVDTWSEQDLARSNEKLKAENAALRSRALTDLEARRGGGCPPQAIARARKRLLEGDTKAALEEMERALDQGAPEWRGWI